MCHPVLPPEQNGNPKGIETNSTFLYKLPGLWAEYVTFRTIWWETQCWSARPKAAVRIPSFELHLFHHVILGIHTQPWLKLILAICSIQFPRLDPRGWERRERRVMTQLLMMIMMTAAVGVHALARCTLVDPSIDWSEKATHFKGTKGIEKGTQRP